MSRKRSCALGVFAAGATFCASQSALASSPLEYPDNGSAQFSRGGAWLATANEPIATHYNPAALATQGSGFSIEQNLNFQHVCYDRHGPNGAPETIAPPVQVQYAPVCDNRGSFPTTIPSISLAWRVSKKLGLGLSIVPPAVYGNSDEQFPLFKPALNTLTNQLQLAPAPYRYQQLNQLSTILFPTVGVGYEVLPKLRVGAAFISGITIINFNIAGIDTQPATAKGDDYQRDTLSYLHTKDLFVPGGILSMHWSPLPVLDVAAWGRWMSDAVSHSGDLTVLTGPYAGTSALKPLCQVPATTCASAPGVPLTAVNTYGNDTFRSLKFPFPPEVRLGVRFHQPRSKIQEPKYVQRIEPTNEPPVRDPLHDDVFDVELDGSYALNASANTVEVRFVDGPDPTNSKLKNGAGKMTVAPVGYIPPNADKWNGYQNSYGLRLGGQVNVLPDKLGIRAGTWYESQSVDPKWLSISTVGSARGGFGGGLVFRQSFIDISIGYQYNWSSGLDNGGQGAMRAIVGQLSTGASGQGFNTNLEPPGVSAADRKQFRSAQTVNDGRITQSAHVFTLGGTVRF